MQQDVMVPHDALEESHTVAHGLNSMVKGVLLTYWA